MDGHQTLAAELAPNFEDEPGAVEILDVESERFAASQPRDVEQADQDVHGFGQAALRQLLGGGHQLFDLGLGVQVRGDPLVAAADQALGNHSAAPGSAALSQATKALMTPKRRREWPG